MQVFNAKAKTSEGWPQAFCFSYLIFKILECKIKSEIFEYYESETYL